MSIRKYGGITNTVLHVEFVIWEQDYMLMALEMKLPNIGPHVGILSTSNSALPSPKFVRRAKYKAPTVLSLMTQNKTSILTIFFFRNSPQTSL